MKTLHLATATLLVVSLASAQDPSANANTVLPPPPWLKKAPAMSHWVVTYNIESKKQDSTSTPTASLSAGSPNAPKIPPQTIEVTKTGETVLEQTKDGLGNSVQTWRKQGLILAKNSMSKIWQVAPIPPSDDPYEEADYTTADFAGLSWISAKNFSGIELIHGKNCLVFKDKVLALSNTSKIAIQTEVSVAANMSSLVSITKKSSAPSMIDWSKYEVDAEADIDLKTLLPNSLKIGEMTRTYQFLPAPDTDLDLPEDAQIAINAYLKRTATLRNLTAGSP